MNSNDDLKNIYQRLTELKGSITRIESILQATKGSNNQQHQFHPTPTLLITISRTSGKRFPFKVDLTGVITATESLHPVRLALLITLVRDTQDRASGGSGIAEPLNVALSLYKALSNGVDLDDEAKAADAVKAAWYRFETDFISKLKSSSYKLEIHKDQHTLTLRHGSREITDFPVEIVSKDEEIGHLLDEVVPSSPFAKARTRKVLYVPGGPDGFDRLFVDLFNHQHKVHETSLFFKPSIVTYPFHLLNFMRASDEDKKRREVLLEGFKRERCSFDEILNRRTLRNIITYTSKQKFLFYPPEFTQEHIEQHLIEMIRMVSEYKKYRLILTDRPMPFLLGLFNIYYSSEPECYTVFFKQMVAEHDPDINAFIINDQRIFNSVMQDVVERVMADPSTVKDGRKVIDELNRTLRRLREEGPIREDSVET